MLVNGHPVFNYSVTHLLLGLLCIKHPHIMTDRQCFTIAWMYWLLNDENVQGFLTRVFARQTAYVDLSKNITLFPVLTCPITMLFTKSELLIS